MPNPSPAVLVQLPFPSQSDGLASLDAYYEIYGKRYKEIGVDYDVIGDGGLWELPLWVAHLAGLINRDDTSFANLSSLRADAAECVAHLTREYDSDRVLMFSPLAQNFDLASAVSADLRKRGFRTAVGGNMAALAAVEDFTWVHVGHLASGGYEAMVGSPSGHFGQLPQPGIASSSLDYVPNYELLSGIATSPIVRISASHGCLFACSFCGDAWSRQLQIVSRESLAAELASLRELFPNLTTLYVGDKTFGQSPAAVSTLADVLSRHEDLQLVVQTHVSMIRPKLLEVLTSLPVRVVELGFETASTGIISAVRKGRRTEDEVVSAMTSLRERDILPVLNVMGGLPEETPVSQEATIDFLRRHGDIAWLFNLYNFVPYPLTPLFPQLRDRIVDWDFSRWREDRPVVFEPYHQSISDSWAHFVELIDVATQFARPRKLV